MSNLDYIQAQIFKACPFPVQTRKTLKIKLSTEDGKTNWINVTPEQYKSIETILLTEESSK